MAKRRRKARAERAAEPPQTLAQRPGAHAEAAAPAGASAAPQSGASRGFANALIAAFLLLQIAMPLRYYLGGRGYDERFSWRMFSSIRMQRCDVRVNDRLSEGGERRVDLDRELQVAWIGMLERYRAQVVDEFLRRRCALPGVRQAHYERTCRDTDGSALPRLAVTLDCKSQRLDREERAP